MEQKLVKLLNQNMQEAYETPKTANEQLITLE